MPEIYCPIRKGWVTDLPEEQVRVNLLNHMIGALGYPSSGIVVEKGLAAMPHLPLNGQQVPRRRADIIFFAKGIHPEHDLYPLLLVECKSVKLAPKMVNQLVGYNHYMKAIFITLANQNEIRTGWYKPQIGNYEFINFLPAYKDLMANGQEWTKWVGSSSH